MIARILVCLIAALCSSEARVDFNHSQIYDEYDFKYNPTVSIEGLCKDSCRIYASITDDAISFATNLMIQTAKGFVSVADIALRTDPATGQKWYLEVKNKPTLVITNANSRQYDDYPLVVYVVNQGASFYATAEVYEADGFHRPQSTLIQALTVMSASPFTLKQAHDKGSIAGAPQGAIARMTGFDALDYQTDPCPNLYALVYGPFPGFTLQVNGPIVSLQYDVGQFHIPPGDISAIVGTSNRFKLERSGWVGSPGYHGCRNTEVYKSSLYSPSAHMRAEVVSDQPEDMSVDVLTNSDASHSVILTYSDKGDTYSVSNTGDKEPFNFNFKTQNLTITWKPEGTGLTHFLVRWNSTVVPKP